MRVAVIGDLMLDEYVWGDVTRISPDAPVQVVEVRRRTRAIGGAGNVAHNIASAGGAPCLFGVVGADEAGSGLAALLREAGVEISGVIEEPGRTTTVKTRIVARGQHVLRLDQEVKDSLRPNTRARLLAVLSGALPTCEAILVSDYAKGVVDAGLVAEIVSLVLRGGRSRGAIPVVVDPKSDDFARYAGCFAITPNLREAEVAARMRIATEADLEEAARRIRLVAGSPWVLITRGEKGMFLSGPDGGTTAIPARTREVYDVTGAGDIVVGYFGLGVATGLDPPEAAALANVAAGIGVGKVGTTAVGPSEVVAGEMGLRTSQAKVATVAEAAARAGHERSLGRRVVFTNGCFDLLHAGHVHLIERARELGEFLILAVNGDASVRRLKGEGRPVLSEADRVKILAALDAVDLVVVFDEDTPLELLRRIRPDVLVKGGDYARETIVGFDLVTSYGGSVETIPLATGRSTTGMIDAIHRIEKRS